MGALDNITPNFTEAQKASPRKVNREGRPKTANVKDGLAESTKNLAKVKVEKRVKGRGANLAWATYSEVSKVPNTPVKETIKELQILKVKRQVVRKLKKKPSK